MFGNNHKKKSQGAALENQGINKDFAYYKQI